MTSFRGSSSASSSSGTSMPPLATTSSSIGHGHHHHHTSRPSMADRSIVSYGGMPTPSTSGNGHILSSSSYNNSAPPSSIPSTSNSSTTTIDSPIAAANSAANRSANSAYGLYQNCIALRKKLKRVPGFAERYLVGDSIDSATDQQDGNGSGSSTATAGSPLSPNTSTSTSTTIGGTGPSDIINDPVSQICKCLRLGSSLCYLFNTLGSTTEKKLQVNDQDGTTNNLNFKACQRSAAHFVMACNTTLGWNDEDIFRVSELYSPDTNGTVKVIHTVTKFLNLLEERNLLLPPSQQELREEEEAAAAANSMSSINGILNGNYSTSSIPLSARGNVVKEILMTERKYVQDLEVLQEYSRKLADEQILSQDTIHNLFLNLNSIVDFARRFLIGIEANACLPPDQQRFGSLFLLMEESFAVYEPYCINYLMASEMAASLSKQEGSPLGRVSHILDPNELLMFHIKPVQRLLKYHLLFESLAKASDASWPYHAELLQGVDTAKRIADRVNEETRKQENKRAVEELGGRVEDWKGHELSSFGELLLHETFQVIKSEVEREYHVYLFQKIILCCKDAPLPPGKSKVNKSNSMIRKSGTSAGPGGQQKHRKPPMQLKGRIFINNVNAATPITKPGSYLLQITWKGDQLDEAFSIKCRSPEQLSQWHKAVSKAVEEMLVRRSRSAGQLRRLASPHSQFPNTPQSELGPMLPGFSGSSASLNSVGGFSQHTPYGGTFEDEGDDGYHGDYEPSTGRSTPSLGAERGGMQRRGAATQSLPPGSRQNAESLIMSNSSRPRAQTEDSNSAVINQWRSQTPNGGYPSVPSLPRQSSASSSAASVGSPMDGPQQHGLRHSASKSALRNKQSSEWSSPGMPGAPASSGSSTVTHSPALNGSIGGNSSGQRGQSIGQQMDEMSLSAGEPLRMLRQNSQGNMPIHNAPPPLRSRSASSPHVYQLPPGQVGQPQGQGQSDKQWTPYPIQDVHPAHFAAQMGRQMSNGRDGQPLKRNIPGNSSTATIASTSGSATTAPPKRLSSSSTGTDRSSGDSSQSQNMPYISPTSSVSVNAIHGGRPYGSRESQPGTYPPPQTPLSPSSAIKVKVSYGEDTFVIVVLSSITYLELVKKVLHKIHLCGARTNGLDANTLRLRYEDEEGDKILMTADDDVAMAFDWLRSGAGHGTSLILFAE